ncbi:MAG: hypothetical protein RBT03_02020 [Kiritimatiellia bacterium]|nr:hypothetical protein [Kiritimatiellia bacterium]
MALTVVLAVFPRGAFGDISATEPAAAEAVVVITEQVAQSGMAELRTEFMQNKREMHQFETQAAQAGPLKELTAEIKQISRQIGDLIEQLEQTPAKSDEWNAQISELREQRKMKVVARLTLLNESEEYRALGSRRADLMEQIRALLSEGASGSGSSSQEMGRE